MNSLLGGLGVQVELSMISELLSLVYDHFLQILGWADPARYSLCTGTPLLELLFLPCGSPLRVCHHLEPAPPDSRSHAQSYWHSANHSCTTSSNAAHETKAQSILNLAAQPPIHTPQPDELFRKQHNIASSEHLPFPAKHYFTLSKVSITTALLGSTTFKTSLSPDLKPPRIRSIPKEAQKYYLLNHTSRSSTACRSICKTIDPRI